MTMTVKQLIEELSKFPESREVVIPDSSGDFKFIPVEFVRLENVEWVDPIDNLKAIEECVYLTNDAID